jgi:AraC-like DNA-binding protein
MGRAPHTEDGWRALAKAARYNSKEVAKLCDLSPRQLQRKFRLQFHCSPHVWLNHQRMLAARELLLTGAPVKKVAFELGFKQVSHFYRHFRRDCRMTPLEFVLLKSLPPLERRSEITNVAVGESFGLGLGPGTVAN